MPNMPSIPQQVYYWNPVHNGPNRMQLRLQQHEVRQRQRQNNVNAQKQQQRSRGNRRINSQTGKYPLPEAEPVSIPERIMEQENTPPVQETQTLQSQGRYSKTPESLLPLHLEKMRLANMVLPKPSNKPAPAPIMNDSDQNQASRFTIKTDDETSHYATPFANRALAKRHKDRLCSTINQSRATTSNLTCNQSPIKPKSIVITAGNESIVLEVDNDRGRKAVGVTIRPLPSWASQMQNESEKKLIKEIRSCADLNTVDDKEWDTVEELQIGHPVKTQTKLMAEPDSVDFLSTTMNQTKMRMSRELNSTMTRKRVNLNTSKVTRNNPGGKSTFKTRRKKMLNKRTLDEQIMEQFADSAVTSGSCEPRTVENVDKPKKRNLKKKISSLFGFDKHKMSKSSSGFSENSKQSNSSQQ